jgi:very-short-patch-repair endonuclease
MRRTSNDAIVKARELRRSMTLPEGRLWHELRKRAGGFKFRRQHPFGPFVLDFFCPAANLAIEVDGASHDMGDNPRRDSRRDEWLTSQGLRVMRFTAADVLHHIDGVIRMILADCSA